MGRFTALALTFASDRTRLERQCDGERGRRGRGCERDRQRVITNRQGVSGAGKSTLGTALAKALHLPFIDGDDLHPPANVAKMARGEALGDVDRMPWLEAVRRAAVARVVGQVGEEESDDKETWRPGVVVACSALKKTYRAVLRGETSGAGASVPTYIVYLKGDREVLMARMLGRQGHFMKAGMLESQLATLESPEGEPGVVSVSVGVSTEVQVQTVADALRSWS